MDLHITDGRRIAHQKFTLHEGLHVWSLHSRSHQKIGSHFSLIIKTTPTVLCLHAHRLQNRFSKDSHFGPAKKQARQNLLTPKSFKMTGSSKYLRKFSVGGT